MPVPAKKIILTSGSDLIKSGYVTFNYELLGTTESQLRIFTEGSNFPTKPNFRDDVMRIVESASDLKFIEIESKIFEKNLRRIDSMLPEFLAEMLIGLLRGKGNNLDDLVTYLSQSSFRSSHYDILLSREVYEVKIKQFLLTIILGMTSLELWRETPHLNRVCTIVSKTGEAQSYNAFNQRSFVDKIYRNSKFVRSFDEGTPFMKAGSKRIKALISLNLQIQLR